MAEGEKKGQGEWGRRLQLILKLGRMKMTVFSAVTYGAAASLAGLRELDSTLFVTGWAFVFFTQTVAHFLGEYYDLYSDKLNVHAGPLTGGSKVLLTGDITPRQCFALGYLSLAISTSILIGVLPQHCWALGFVLTFIAHQYSAPPFKLNHRGVGEIAASAATNIFLPVFAALVQPPPSGSHEDRLSGGDEQAWGFYRSLAILVVPSFFLKVGLFIALNMADRRPDWLGGKYTVPVLLGDETAARLLGACNILAYLSAVLIYAMGLCHVTTLIAILMSAPEGLRIALAFNPSILTEKNTQSGKEQESNFVPRRPYRLEGLVVRVLKHAPGVVLAVFADTVVRESFAAGLTATASLSAENGGHIAGYFETLLQWLTGVVGILWSSSLPLRCLPLIPFVYTFLLRAPPRPPARLSAEPESPPADGVIIAGGGIGGLVLGACLHELGLPFEVLEKSPRGEIDGGADLALWPAATKILKELGVGSTESTGEGFVDAVDFWAQKTYPVHLVRMAKVSQDNSTAATTPSDSRDESGAQSSVVAAPEVILTKVDMDAVVEGEGEPFQLVGRQALMSALLPLLPAETIHRGTRVSRAEQTFKPGAHAAAAAYVVETTDPITCDGAASRKGGDGTAGEQRLCRVLVGADGIHSVCRVEVSAAAAAASVVGCQGCECGAAPRDASATSAVRDGGEVCYRGVLDLREGSAAAVAGLRPLFEEDEQARPGSMGVIYGDRIRFSWGFLDNARETGYWFVKELTEHGEDGRVKAERRGEGWPEPLRTFARLTQEECTYAHRIQDRPPLPRWSCGNITLLGDACHPATPNNGQGACMAIEDAFVLATLLAEYWEKPDGHVEAFYLYERSRLQHTKGVQRESYKQMKLGQLTGAVGIWVREFAIRNIPPAVLQKKLRAANVFGIDPWLKRFRALKSKRNAVGST